MRYVNEAANALFAAILGPFQGRNPWYGMIVVSLLSSIILLAIFKVTSDRQAIRRNKNRAVARLLELLLFKDDIVVNLGALGRTIAANAAYLGTMLRPMLFGVLPFLLILVQVSVWFAYRPLQTGESALVKVSLSDDTPVVLQDISVEPSPGIAIETDAVRIPSRNEVAWRVQARAGGSQSIDFVVNGRREQKTLAVGAQPCPVSPVRIRAGVWDELTNPVEPPLPSAGAMSRIEVAYPSADLDFGSFKLHWLLVYIVLTMGIAWVLKTPFRVEI